MTKAELLQALKDKDVVIADLNTKIDELEGMAITSQVIPLDADTSRMLSLMNQRIKSLEERLNNDGK